MNLRFSLLLTLFTYQYFIPSVTVLPKHNSANCLVSLVPNISVQSASAPLLKREECYSGAYAILLTT